MAPTAPKGNSKPLFTAEAKLEKDFAHSNSTSHSRFRKSSTRAVDAAHSATCEPLHFATGLAVRDAFLDSCILHVLHIETLMNHFDELIVISA